jgi:hypothetical protein
MNAEKLREEYTILLEEKKGLVTKLDGLEKEKNILKARVEQIEKSLYEKTISMCHINEIFRVAEMQFSRLRGTKKGLTAEDIKELNKWIGRALSEDSLKDIVNALNELKKYLPSQIRQNLYALVQKIIIGGAFTQKNN